MKNRKSVKFIYFDVGGVAILDYSKTNKWNEMLDDLGLTGDVRSEFEALYDNHEQQICIGEDINIFVEEAKTKLGIKFPDNYNMTKDFVNRFERNNMILKLVDRLRKNFSLGLLTNQYPNMLNLIFQKQLMPADIWDVIIDSSVEKIAKPDLAIYTLAENRAKADPKSIMFIDNKDSLLQIPRQRGWCTFLYDPSNVELTTLELERFIYS